MKKFTWHDLLTVALCCLVFGTIGGYGWRMHHETKAPAPSLIYIADLSMEIGKGHEFWLPVDGNETLHFLPLRGARFEMAVRREARP